MTSSAGATPAYAAAEGAKVAPRSRRDRYSRRAMWIVTAFVACLAIAVPIRHVLTPEYVSFLWMRDFDMYRDATARFFGGGPYYLPEQLMGPYGLAHGHVLYPPPSVLLFAPFTVLPAVLWWVIPLAVTAGVIARLRPHPSVWPLIIACFAWPPTLVKLFTGNPVIWVMAAVALSRLVPWASAFALVKPSLFPFALLGIRHRSWWITVGALLAGSLVLAPFLPSWPEFFHVVRDAGDPSGGFYSIAEVPMLLIPLLAGWGRTRPARAAPDTVP